MERYEKIPYGYIYKTTNLINGKIYIGQHKWSKYPLKDITYIGSGIRLENAISKYGKENFSCFILQWCYTSWELDIREKAWILFYNSQDKNIGYNISSGGSGGIEQEGDKNSNAKLSIDIVLKIVDMRDKGCKLKYIADKFNIPLLTISHICNGYTWGSVTGIKYKKEKKFTENEYDDIMEYYNNNYSIKEISNLTNIKESSIENIISGKIGSEYTGIIFQKEKKKVGFSEDEYKKILDMKKCNKSVAEIASFFNVLPYKIKQVLNGSIGSEYTGILYNPNKKYNRRLTKDEVKSIIELYENKNITYTEIAKKFDITIKTVKDVSLGNNKFGLKANIIRDSFSGCRKLSNENIIEIINLWNNEWLEEDIAKKFDVSRIQINRIIRGKIHSEITKNLNVREKPKRRPKKKG